MLPYLIFQGGFAHGVLVGGGIDCVLPGAVAASLPPAALEGTSETPASLLELGWGNLLGGTTAPRPAAADCLLVGRGAAAVPDSAADEGVPLPVRGAAVAASSPGSSIAGGPRAQGAAVPMGGLGGLVVWGKGGFAPVLVVPGTLVARFDHGVCVPG